KIDKYKRDGVVWGVAGLRWPVWKLFAAGCACWIWWAIGWTLLIGNSTLDIHLHDTYFVIAGYHYAFLLLMIMFVLTVIYYLLERKVYVNRVLGRLHFWVTFVGLWYLWWPGSFEGLAGMPRRYIDVGYFNGFNRLVNVDRTMVIVVAVIVMQLVFVGMVVYFGARNFFTRMNN
ncbi:MAG TPA: cbb3-type cytochrome c oxidase subunit I, partial [Puia sp.]|nr:cbb3-type cytochrome c oxidase subunit I [Puia sp.]